MNVTSAIPIINAAAVAAVRPGLRRAFSRPIRLIRVEGITPGNSIGHSGRHFGHDAAQPHREHDRKQQ